MPTKHLRQRRGDLPILNRGQLHTLRRVSNLPNFLLFMIVAVILFSVGSTRAAEESRRVDDILLDTYYRLEGKLAGNSFGFPLFLESSDKDGRLHVDVYGIFDHSFSSLREVVKVPANWCDIASLHPNVKACTYRELAGTWRLTFYGGRKVYQSPEDTYQFTYLCRSVEQRPGRLDIVLNADEGPFGTKDHTMRFEAVPIDGGRTFVHVSYAYRYGSSLRFAEKIYFATLGHGKVGFTVKGTDRNGDPIYIGGPRGAIERNAVRFYFAIQSFMNTLRYPEESRFSMRTSDWYDRTSRYRKQLFEMEKRDYVMFKAEEHKKQVMLQRQISMSLQ